MKVLVTGSAGRVGRHIYIHLMHQAYQVVGIDQTPCSTTDYIGDIRDKELLQKALKGVDIVVHTAGLHAPHVGIRSEQDFIDINVTATKQLIHISHNMGVSQFIFTSTTALYGKSATPKGKAGWVTELIEPQPRTIYHRSKIQGERILEDFSRSHGLDVTVLQMSRCFPEPANLMAIYRLTRGIDPRDVAAAHVCAVQKQLKGFNRFIISGKTPFNKDDCQALYINADKLITIRVPAIASAFHARNWSLPKSLDRVYDSSSAQNKLTWYPKYGFETVLEQLDQRIAEVLPGHN